MLDPETPATVTPEVADTTPPRRRRAASRPAGPPVERPASTEPVTAAATAVDESRSATFEAVAQLLAAEGLGDAEPEVTVSPARRSRRTPVAGAVEDAGATPAPRTRRRATTAVPPAEEEDLVGASLEALAKTTRPRTRRARAADAAKTLDNLAAAIGAEELPEPVVGEELETESIEAPEESDLTEVAAEDYAGDGAAVAESTEADLDTEDDEPGEDEDEEGEEEAEAPGVIRRRRRRRGGRRRRRGTPEEVAVAEDEHVQAGEEEHVETEPVHEGDLVPEDHPESTSRRRRRRRRRGEDTSGAEDDPTEVVIRVREPRRTRTPVPSDEVTGIDGSTRIEAKRQRRREGRAAGRRRAPILSEAEFLARRESVDRKMLIRQSDEFTQIAVLEDGVLVEHYVDRATATSMIGNVYLGRVQNVLPSMEAAFIDIGRGRNGVLYAGEVDWDAYGVTGADRKMEKVLKSGQVVLVQVSKDPVGAKGARLTAHVSIPGRYVVYSPNGELSGISRKLSDAERNRLKGILDDLVGANASVIVRTAAEGATEEELVRDVNRLKAQWEVIEKKVKAGKAPELLYAEPDLTVRIVRDLFTEDFNQLIVDGNGQGEDAYDTVEGYVSYVAPHLRDRLVRWHRAESGDLFASYRIDEQISKALERKVFLPSGGSLIIDRTEAMTVIDVNTGKFTGTSGNLEATVTSNNLEAAEEIVRQLRLRDIGGIIVIDFIDMVLPSNRELLLRRLVECLSRDRTRHQVAEVTSLGLVQMTRKKIGTGLAEAFMVPCETCRGRGYHRHDTPVESQVPVEAPEREPARRRR